MTDNLTDRIARQVWETSRADESTISFAGANIVARALVASGVVADPAEVERFKRAAVDARDELDDMHRQLNAVRLDLARKSAEFVALTMRAEEGGISEQEIVRIGDQAWTAVDDAAERLTEERDRLRAVVSEMSEVNAILARHGVTGSQPAQHQEQP